MWPELPCNICCCAPIRTGISPKVWSSRASSPWTRRCARCARKPRSRTWRSIGAQDFMDTGPYNKGKISRYYVARSNDTRVHLPINPELGFPEHQEARWVGFDTALCMVSPRLKPVIHWASDIIAAPHGAHGCHQRVMRASADLEHIAADEDLAPRGSPRETEWKAGPRIRPERSAAEPAASASSPNTRRRNWRSPSRWRDPREWRRRPERRNAPALDRGSRWRRSSKKRRPC